MIKLNDNQVLYPHINQNGVRPGPRKLAQFIQAMKLRNVPKLYSQDGKGDDARVFVKLFDPCGSMTWFITEFSEVAPDGYPNLAFGYVTGGFEPELGYISLDELANVQGPLGIGIEIDTHSFLPKTLAEVKALGHRA